MHLVIQLGEDARGRRLVQEELFLHEGPTRPWSLVDPGRHVGTLASSPERSGRTLVMLIIQAPDDIDDAQLEARLREIRDELAQASDEWTTSGDVTARFLLADGPALADWNAVVEQLLGAATARHRRRRRWTPLRVQRLDFMDFRGVDRLSLPLCSKQTNVLVGVNGSGKTTVLEAAALLLSRLQAGILRAPRRSRAFGDKDIMNEQGSAEVAITAAIGGNPVTWSLTRTRGGELPPASERVDLSSLDAGIARIHAELERGDVCPPVVVYYPVNRAVLDIPLRIRTTHGFEPLEAYDGALTGDRRSFRLFFEWFREREDLENEMRISISAHRDHQLEAVRRAIHSLVPEFANLRVKRSPLGMVVDKGERMLYVDQLSDGEKCLLAMVGDLARRLAMANPLADDPLRGGGVVLIDEIELHLHPGWQRRVVPALERTFPNCQLILTTHSPAVLSHVDHESIFILQPEASGIRAVHPDTSKGMDVGRVLEDLLGVPARPDEFTKKLDELYRSIDGGDTAGARALHRELTATLGQLDPALVRAEVLLRRREAAGR